MKRFKRQANSTIIHSKTAAPIDLLKLIRKQNVQDIYIRTEIALRIFLTVPVTTAGREKNVIANLN